MQQQLQGGATDPCRAAHWALSLGLSEVVAARLGEGAGDLSAEQVRGLVFRITRKSGDAKTHQQLFTAATLESLRQRWDQLNKATRPIAIALHGGIGDHLQDLSTLIPLLRGSRQVFRVHLAPERLAQLRRLLQNTAGDVETCCEGLLTSEGLHVLELMAVLGSKGRQPQAWISATPTRPVRHRLLCCWTAQGQGDRFSSWSRSLPFAAVLGLYQTLVARGWEPQTIVDITAWKPWEAAALRQLGVQLVDPAAGDVLELAELVHCCDQVISIDSALVHLCAAMGRAVHLLLPKYHDERWVALLPQGSSYARCCQVWRQARFDCWQAPLQQLEAAISKPGAAGPGP
uniref:hypothetical protein n=1 Tax=Cyanobium sp. TaxID=2164130 RepID=UPI004048AFFB